MTTTINRFECACEHGGDCTRTTMCKLQSVSDDLENEVEALTEQLEQVSEYLIKHRRKEARLHDNCKCYLCMAIAILDNK
jgi:hypothetical protein